MKIVIGEIRENDVVCETDRKTIILPKRLFQKRIYVGDIASYEDGEVLMWDEDAQYEEEQLNMLFKMLM